MGKLQTESLSHIGYASAGSKTVTLTLTDSCGAQGSMTRTIVISNPDPCAGNQAPIAQASANPASAEINQPISFSAAGSSDPNGSIASYSWNFGNGSTGSGLNASHAYANAGNFNVILTITDNCGAIATKTISVTITNPSQGLQADFKVYKLTHVDTQTGEETWEEIVLPNPDHPVELGLRLKFDASPSSGPIAFAYFSPGGGGAWPNGGLKITQSFNAQGPKNVHLQLYNSSWSQSTTITKTIHVAAGTMEWVDTSGSTIGGFWPKFYVQEGTNLWTTDAGGNIGVVQISDPNSLPQVQIVGHNLVQYPRGISIASNKLFIAHGGAFNSAVSIIDANLENFHLIRKIEIGSTWSTDAQPIVSTTINNPRTAFGFENVLLVTDMPNQLLVFDITNPIAPILLKLIVLPFAIDRFVALGNKEGLIGYCFGSPNALLLDTRVPASPLISETFSFGGGIEAHSVYEYSFTLRVPEAQKMSRLLVPTNSSAALSLEPFQHVAVVGSVVALAPQRLYKMGLDDFANPRLFKYDITDPENSYLMESFNNQMFYASGSGGPFFFYRYPSNQNSLERIFAGIGWSGWISYKP